MAFAENVAVVEAEITLAPRVQLRQLAAFARAPNPAGQSFSLWDLTLQAAVAGQGVALGRSTLTAQYLKTRQLVRPFKISSPAALGYYLVCLPERIKDPKISAFRSWLLEVIAAAKE